MFDVVLDVDLFKKSIVPPWASNVETGCLNQANQSAAVVDTDAKIDDLARNWNPTGYYSPADIYTAMKSVTDAITSARAALIGAVLSTSDAAQQVAQAQAYLNRSTERAAVYTAAIANAKASGISAINAPGLKQWVLESMVNVGQAFTTVAMLQCNSSWLDTAASVLSAVWGVVKRIAGIVLKVGETVLDAADDVLDLYKVLKWGALGVGAFILVSKLRDWRAGK